MVPLLDCMGVRHFGDVDCPLFTPIDTVAGEAIEARCEANPPCSNYNPMHFRPDLAWDDLEDRLIWRGSNLRMADEIPGGMPLSSSNRAVLDAILALEGESGPEGVTASRLLQKVVDSPTASTQVTPRLKATLMSAAAREAREANAASLSAAAERSTELAASLQSFDLDALFTRKDLEAPDSYELYDALQNHGIVITAPERLDAEELSKFRYHIDLGGAGGTTWSGLFAKLAMPGLLFHHQTVMSDFFVGDELVPWSHFVPVKQDLSDLPEKLDWARAHPVEAQQIARQGSDFMKKLRDDPSVRKRFSGNTSEIERTTSSISTRTEGTRRRVDFAPRRVLRSRCDAGSARVASGCRNRPCEGRRSLALQQLSEIASSSTNNTRRRTLREMCRFSVDVRSSGAGSRPISL